jgi:hypothetical protein
MKNNRKNRALKYIREKNGYNKGRPFAFFTKVSAQLANENIDIVSDMVFCESEKQKTLFEKKFKMPFQAIDFKLGQESDDYIKSIYTAKVTFKKVLPIFETMPNGKVVRIK